MVQRFSQIIFAMQERLYNDLREAAEGSLELDGAQAWRYVELRNVRNGVSNVDKNLQLSKPFFEHLYKPLNHSSGYVLVGWTTWQSKCQALMQRGLILDSEYDKLILKPGAIDKATGLY